MLPKTVVCVRACAACACSRLFRKEQTHLLMLGTSRLLGTASVDADPPPLLHASASVGLVHSLLLANSS